MPSVTAPSPEFVDLCQALYGDLVNVEALWSEVAKMSPDPSSVSVPGAKIALRPTRRTVGKADIPIGALVQGRLSTLGMMTQRADPILAGGAKAATTRAAATEAKATQAATAATVPPSPRQVAANAKPIAAVPPRSVPGDPVPTPVAPTPVAPTPAAAPMPAPAAPTAPAAAPAPGSQASGAAAAADGAAAGQGLRQTLGTTTGKVVLGSAGIMAYRTGKNRGSAQAYGNADPYAYSKGWSNPMAPDPAPADPAPAGPSPTTRKVVAGLSATGAVAGATGLAVAGREVAERAGGAGLRAGLKATPKLTRALIPLEVAGLGGELAATKILHGDSQQQPTSKSAARTLLGATGGYAAGAVAGAKAAKPLASKAERYALKRGMSQDSAEGVRIAVRSLGSIIGGSPGAVAGSRLAARSSRLAKSVDDVQWDGTFSKFDDDKRLAFGWASVVKVNGEPVIDRQGDYIGIGDIEDAAYVYVEKSRVGGDMHRRVGGKDFAGQDRPHHVADLVESMVFTPEKIEKMGLPRDFPVGWWVGFKVHDDDAWTEVKKGNRTGFSIHGRGIRKDVDYDSIMAGV